MLPITDFKGAAKRLESIDIPRIGSRIGVGEDELHAFMEVEANGSGFDSKGRPKMLFEPHKFYWNLPSSKRAAAVKAKLAYPNWKPGDYPKESYTRLAKAMEIDYEAALKSASWGLTQILGENHEMIGYPTVEAMVRAFMDDEEHHLEGAVNFLIASGIDDDLRAHRWDVVARVYNGPKYKVHGYDRRLAAAFERWKRIPDTPWEGGDPTVVVVPQKTEYPEVRLGSKGFMVEHLQKALRDLGYPVGAIDGTYGPTTRGVVLMFQSDNGLETDGLVGDKTWTALELARARPVAEARAEATVSDLREKGSRTVAQADAIQAGGAVVTGLGALDMASGYVEKLETSSGLLGRVGDALGPVKDTLDPALAFMTDNWQLLALAGGAYLVYKSGVLKRIRLEDHRSGKNGGR